MNLARHNKSLIIFFIVSISYLAYLIIKNPNFIINDCGLFFICAKKILQGEIPYIDFIEHNLPLIYLLNLIPAFINLRYNINIALSFSFYILGLIIISFIYLYYLLYKYNKLNGIYQTLLISYLIFNIFSFETFGQREHLLIIFSTPYLLIRCLKYDGITINKLESLLCGLLFSLGILIKPWYIVAYLAFEIGLKIKNKQKLPNIIFETSGLLLGCFGYAIYMITLPKNALQYYLNPIFILTASGYRDFQSNSFNVALSYLLHLDILSPKSLYVAVPYFFLCFLILFIYINLKFKQNAIFNYAVISYLLVSVIIFLIFPPILDYHCLPIQFSFYWLVMIDLYLTFNLIFSNESINPKILINKNLIYYFSVILIFTLLKPYGEKPRENPLTTIYQKLTQRTDKIVVLGTDPYLLPELSDRTSLNKYMPESYPVNEFITINSTKTISDSIKKISLVTEKEYLIYLNNIIDTKKPKLIIIQADKLAVLDWLEYFKRNGFFDKVIKSYTVLNKGFEGFNYPDKYQECKSRFTQNIEFADFLFLKRKNN